jgi:cyanophycinase
MRPVLIRAATLLIVLTATLAAFSQQRLLAVGGGKRPPEAMRKFVGWAGGEKAKIVVITWATEYPDESFEGLRADLSKFTTAAVLHAPQQPLDAEKRSMLVEQLASATGIFFSGGDQNRIMDVLADPGLYRLIRDRYDAGVVVGGTSAGAAALSDPMMTGEADLKLLDGSKVGVRKGLGFVPDVIFDQHFLVRQRHNRLIGLMTVNPSMFGIGIDEDMAVAVVDGRYAEIFGPTHVLLLGPRDRKGAFPMYILSAGQRFDLKKGTLAVRKAG